MTQRFSEKYETSYPKSYNESGIKLESIARCSLSLLLVLCHSLSNYMKQLRNPINIPEYCDKCFISTSECFDI